MDDNQRINQAIHDAAVAANFGAFHLAEQIERRLRQGPLTPDEMSAEFGDNEQMNAALRYLLDDDRVTLTERATDGIGAYTLVESPRRAEIDTLTHNLRRLTDLWAEFREGGTEVKRAHILAALDNAMFDAALDLDEDLQ